MNGKNAYSRGNLLASGAIDYDLIETMRFEPEGGIAMLEAHLDRMRKSAAALGFVFDRHEARNELQAATFKHGDPAKLRLLLSPSGAMAIELTPLPRTGEPLTVTIAPLPVDPDDERLGHKTTARRFYDEAREAAGSDEVVFTDPQGRLTEGSFTTIFVEQDGKLATPPLELGLLPGILRGALIEEGRAFERDLVADDLKNGFFVGNSVRGLVRATLA